MSFKTIAVITAIIGLVLGAAYLFVGKLVIGRWQIEPTDSVLLLGRRIGVLYLGLSLMFFLARSAPVSVARTALSAGFASALMILALLGIYEFTAGHVGPGILASAAIEFLLALAYIRVLFTERKAQAAG
jgi:hypothetical protein